MYIVYQQTPTKVSVFAGRTDEEDFRQAKQAAAVLASKKSNNVVYVARVVSMFETTNPKVLEKTVNELGEILG